MSFECRKAIQRRLHDPLFHRIFCGYGLDVGSGEDGLSRYAFMFPRLIGVRDWNLDPDGDGQTLPGEQQNQYDFVHSSHSLEHMADPFLALSRWLEVVRPNGHIVLLVPDFDLYEHRRWPSENFEHTHAFTLGPTSEPWLVNLFDLALHFVDRALTVKVSRLEATFDFGADPLLDQTCYGHGASESAIEMVLRKR
jgi:SAM-dependent methyltransferase